MITNAFDNLLTMLTPVTQVNTVTNITNNQTTQEFVQYKSTEYPNGQVVHDSAVVSSKTIGRHIDIYAQAESPFTIRSN